MKYLVALLLLIGCEFPSRAQAPPASPLPEQKPPAAVPSPPPQTEVVAPSQTPPPGESTAPVEAGYLQPAEVKSSLHSLWLVLFRINDLLGEIHAERWKMPDVAAGSFEQTLETLRTELAQLQEYQKQFEERPDSMYLGYETYAAIDAVLPRLGGVAQSVAKHENASLAVQYSQAQNQLFDWQQGIEPYLRYLLRSQDQLLMANQTNLAGCQNQLGYAMRAAAAPAKPIANGRRARPERRWLGRRSVPRAASRGRKPTAKKPEAITPAAPDAKTAPPGKPGSP
jgi:hypothetical protein